MILRMALRSLVSQPVRSAVLTCGFGMGIACMAGLLGVGRVILDQSRSPYLRGGGDLVIYGAAGPLGSARFLTSEILGSASNEGRVAVASPSLDATLYLVREDGSEPVALQARGAIPSLARALGDPETSRIETWRDTQADLAWVDPAPGSVLRAMDRFHPIPEGYEDSDSWAEWLYFNGKTDDARFYLTFLVGPQVAPDRRSAFVRLQLERDERIVNYIERAEIEQRPGLDEAPDLRIGASRVSLEGSRYRIRLQLPAEIEGQSPVSGELTLDATGGRSLPPFEIAGAGGWVSGYTVPVLSGALGGSLEVGGREIPFDGGVGYHDHNWGFWEGVTWQWGQVAGPEFSVLYGRIQPPEDVAAAESVPGFLLLLGPEGPLGFSTDVTIEEIDDPVSGHPRTIVVRATGDSVDLQMNLTVESVTGQRLAREASGQFLQLRAAYDVRGSAADQPIRFTALGSAETFRSR